jgi:hypothetical protein
LAATGTDVGLTKASEKLQTKRREALEKAAMLKILPSFDG